MEYSLPITITSQSPSSNTSSAATKSVKSNANSIDCNKCKKICK